MPRRARDRRTNPLSVLAARIDRAAGGPCLSIICPHATEPDRVAMILMACSPGAACPRCDAARQRLVPRPPLTAAVLDDAADPEDEP